MLLFLQAFQVGILWLHDWIPLGRLNDVRAVRAADGTMRLMLTTVVQSVPFTLCLFFTARCGLGPVPLSLRQDLLLCYGILLTGEVRAWWWPYLVQANPFRAARYQRLFGRTHAFLPHRHGIVPNTLHVVLHAATAATCAILLAGMV
ncbi:MAG: hypothetical protein ABF479_09670 [Gluconacetobacter sp.]|uniref:Uncharacterized protein n=1 Tax=Gluconacetobacter dulcium TaxID=2729096 RepID=A0A7W4K0S6_9PROT|nr:hypothetical protein [Gluconacetobacter dulcium]MBB2198299.1 hypothetical protein [Gluconacetobacter dulcium]